MGSLTTNEGQTSGILAGIIAPSLKSRPAFYADTQRKWRHPVYAEPILSGGGASTQTTQIEQVDRRGAATGEGNEHQQNYCRA